MIKNTIILLTALCLLPTASLASESDTFGSVGIGVRGVNDNGDSAKFNEYRDLDDGVYGDAQLHAFKGHYYLDLRTDNVGQDDQSYELKGGRFGEFKYSLFYDELQHNLSNDARSYFSGIGSTVLTDSGNAANPSLWTSFDYEIEHKTYGLETEVSLDSPFYFELGATRRESDGLLPYGGFSSQTEMPAPVDWTEDTAFIGGGYQSDDLVVSFKAALSEFDNSKETLQWASNRITSLAPDSDYYKLSGQLRWQTPFMDSVLAVRTSYSQLENSLDLYKTEWNNANPNPGKFDGEISYTSFDIVYDISPIESLDLQTYFKYYDRENDSDQFSSAVTTDENDLFEYEKTTFGLEGAYKLPFKTWLEAGLIYTDTDRDGRSDNDNSEDHLFFTQMRSRSMDDIELRARYEYLDRDGNFKGDPSDDVRAYDVADQERDRLELGAAWYVSESLDLGLDYSWSDAEYEDTTLGLTDDESWEIYLSSNYALPELFTLSAYLGYEDNENNVQTDEANQEASSETYAYGLAIEVPLRNDLVLTAAWNYANVEGEIKFNKLLSGSLPEKLGDVDSYSKNDLELSCKYGFNEKLDIVVGYIYEKYKFEDDQWEGYTYTSPPANLTGAYEDQDYEANIGYLKINYIF